jgi:23S rRNA (adenine2503-C2)-methyltransferase
MTTLAPPARDLLTVVYEARREDRFDALTFDSQVAHKYVLRLADGNQVETAAYEHFRDGRRVRLAVDVSTMVGCPMRCVFCDAASLRYVRNLTPDEMTAQYAMAVDAHAGDVGRLSASFQGIGETSLVDRLVVEAAERMVAHDPRTDITISTLGASPTAFAVWRDSGLPIGSVQLSAPGSTDAQVRAIAPRSPRLKTLVAELAACAECATIEEARLNYILIDGYNDSTEDARRLAALVGDAAIRVKVSCLNPTMSAARAGLEPATRARAEEFCAELGAHGTRAQVFGSFGDGHFSCGQLIHLYLSESARRARGGKEPPDA